MKEPETGLVPVDRLLESQLETHNNSVIVIEFTKQTRAVTVKNISPYPQQSITISNTGEPQYFSLQGIIEKFATYQKSRCCLQFIPRQPGRRIEDPALKYLGALNRHAKMTHLEG